MTESPAASSIGARVATVLMTEEAIYGVILISGMMVVANLSTGTALDAFAAVLVTVAVFFLAHVYAGTIARMAAEEGHGDLGLSIRLSVQHSRGLLIVSLVPLVVLALGLIGILDDEVALWVALGVNVVSLAVLGWLAVAKWSTDPWARLVSALTTAAMGVIVMGLKALIHH